ncbi:MAG: alpha/beta fold hydrolase [Promethearchaeota archaeon]
MPFVKTKKGYEIYYIEKGQGENLVFLYGFLMNSWVFETQMEYFSKNYHAITIDYLGHGKSNKPESEAYELQDLAQYVEEALSQILRDEKVILVGHSMGGMIALIYATTPNLAKRLKGLVLMSTAPKLRNPGLDQYVEDLNAGKISFKDENATRNILVNLCFHRKYKKEHPDVIETFVQSALNNEVYVALRTMNSIVKKYNVENKLKDINCPTLILAGNKDGFIPPIESEKMHSVIPNSKLIIFAPRISHMIQFEAQDDYHKAIEDFIGSL